MTVSPNLMKNSRLIARTIRPIGVSALHGIAFLGETLFAVDRLRGFLLKVDPKTDNTTIVNPYLVSEFTDVTGLAIWENTLWYTRDERVYFCENALQEDRVVNLAPQLFATLPYEAEGIAVWQSTVYVSCAKLGYIFVFNRETGREITRFYAPGIGRENLTVYDEELWVCDQIEQTVYCLERGTGKTKFSVLTPFEFPSGLGFYRDENTGEKVLYVAYSGDELYIRDDPNS